LSKKLVVIRTLRGGIKRHTLRNAVEVESKTYARALTDHFKQLGRARLHLLDCSEIRCVVPEVFDAIVAVHKRLKLQGRKLVISAGDNVRRYSQYRQGFCADGVEVCLTEEDAVRELLASPMNR